MPVNGSKDITLALSMSELEHMSTSVVICDQDIAGLGRGGKGHRAVMGVYEGNERGIYSKEVGGAGGGHELKPSPPMSAKLTLEVKAGENKIILEKPVPISCAGLRALKLQQEKRFVPLSEPRRPGHRVISAYSFHYSNTAHPIASSMLQNV